MTRIYLNDGWIFYPSWNDTCIRNSVAARGEKVRIPHTAATLSYNYADPADYQKVCGYVRMLPVPEDFFGKELWLTFEGVAHTAEVFVNGQSVARHYCGYTAFSADMTPYVRFGCENLITVKVDSREDPDVPPFGGKLDYLAYGGIYRDVYLEVRNPAHIEDIFIRTKNKTMAPDAQSGKGAAFGKSVHAAHTETAYAGPASMALSVRLSQKAFLGLGAAGKKGRDKKSDSGNGYLQVFVFDSADNCLGIRKYRMAHFFDKKPASFERNKSRTATIRMDFEHVSYWDIEQPRLYYAEVLLYGDDGRILDSRRVRFGFREIRFRADGFYLNGRKVKLLGLNRHQSYPYVGYAVPESMQKLDARLLKHELGVNAVRTSHYPQSQHFIDGCDEQGILVFTEIPGWEHIGNRRWQSIAVNNVREMIAQYRNHPSIILWGVRVNESGDKDDLYIKTNALAHRMDPTRFTGGVRCLKNSSFLEDVYTYNDFSYDRSLPALLPRKKVTGDVVCPYVVSEHTGHMYPAKMFDDEAHRLEHALRHARVLEAAFAQDTIAGSFGWCMFDYQTHKEFGSGDGICYHGVMDMFRNPKLAGWLYASQGSATVCEIASSVAPGDYAAARPGSLWIFTNCDHVRVFREGSDLGEFFPDKYHFGHLPHPPIEIPASVLYDSNVSWGRGAAVFRFEFIKDGHLCRRIIRRPSAGVYLDVLCSHTRLVEHHSYDMALLRIRAVDAQGLMLPYYNEPVRLKACGPIAVTGPDIISLKGGCGGALIRTLGGCGPAKVTLFARGLEPVEIYMEVCCKSAGHGMAAALEADDSTDL